MTGTRMLLELVIVLGTAAVVTVAFQAVRLPVVLGYVLAGLVIGPHVPLPLVADPQLVHVLSELGVILLMFTIGLELPLAAFRRVGLPTALTALFEVGAVLALGTLAARALGFSPSTALLAGACVAISSTMLAAKAFEEHGWTGGFTELVFAILVFEDLIAIVLLAILTGVASGHELDAAGVALLVGKLAAFIGLVAIAGLLVVPPVFRWIARRARPETLLVGALALCFGMAALFESVGYSVALGAFIAGVLVAESGRGRETFELVRPFRDAFAMVFFVSVGMTIDPAELLAEAPAIAAFTAVVLVGKPLAVGAGNVLAGRGIVPSVRAGLSLAQIGELSFVIAGLAGGRLLAIAVGVSCATTLVFPVLVSGSERAARGVAARMPRRLATFISFYESWLARLRTRGTRLRPLRRAIGILVLDVVVFVAIVATAASFGIDYLREAGLADTAARVVAASIGLVLGAPFVIGAIRRVGGIAHRLAAEAFPTPGSSDLHALDAPGIDPVRLPRVPATLDLARAPRRALVVTLELALGFAIGVPVAAALQPVVPVAPVIVVAIAIVAIFVARRSLADFDGHVRAGSALLLELLAARRDEPLETGDVPLPGFEGLASIAIAAQSPAVGRSLADLDLRARTGATVLAIRRGEIGLATPSPREPLLAGDILAIAGSDDAVAAARAML